MPNIIIEGPKLENIEDKRNFVKEITDIAEKYFKIPREHIIITLKAFPPENVAVGGTLISDRRRP
jgi:4-oxalocrotonate tautomerase